MNNLFEIVIQKDKELVTFLNNLGSEQWDSFWLVITNQFYWAPLFLFILVLIVKAFGWKRGGFMILGLVVLVTFSDQLTVFIKDNSHRLRPNNDPEIMHLLRTLISPQSYSFMSGHATTSTFSAVFIILLLRKKYKYIYLILLFPLFFSYSRLYLAVHFPIDVSAGILTGIILGNLYYLLFHKLEKKLFV